MTDKQKTDLSRFLCLVLRHKPETVGVKIEYKGAWANVDELIRKVNANSKFKLDRRTLEEIAAQDQKGRYSFSADGKKIRCNQGHSFPVELDMEVCVPPDELFHGTAVTSLDSIKAQGIKSMSRNFVHLSKDAETAVKVGARHGRPVVLVIDTKRMTADGHTFMLSDNGVWQFDGVISWGYVKDIIYPETKGQTT